MYRSLPVVLLYLLALSAGLAQARLPEHYDIDSAPSMLPRPQPGNAPVTPRAPSPEDSDGEQGLDQQLVRRVIVGTLALCVAGLLLRRVSRGEAPRPAEPPAASTPPAERPPGSSNASIIALAVASGNAPAGFPLQSFLRTEKASFIRLQQARDRLDLEDIRDYTTPEMFAELSLEMHERGETPQRTDIVALHAELLEVVTDGGHTLASVRFTGQLRINREQHQRVDEVWHVQKDLHDSHWLLAGIQQVTLH